MDVVVIAMMLCVQAASLALHDYPIINSTVDDACENITYKVCLLYNYIMLVNELPLICDTVEARVVANV